jgi:plastocyanin
MQVRPRLLIRLGASLAIVLLLVALLPSAALGADVTVRIGGAFEPADLALTPGSRVTWVNESGERRRVRTSSGPIEIDSGNLEPGQLFSTTLTAPGTYLYLDDRNRDDPAYQGRIVVGEAATGAPGASEGPARSGAAVPAAPSAAPSQASVGMAGRAFGPATVTIAAGGTLTWRNDDDDDHTVTSTAGAFNSGNLAPGTTYQQTFTDPGSFAYLCAIHPEMTGTVVVTVAGAAGSAPTPAPAAAGPSNPPQAAPSTPAAFGASPTAGAERPAATGDPREAEEPEPAAARTGQNLGLLGVLLTIVLGTTGFLLFLRAIADTIPRKR